MERAPALAEKQRWASAAAKVSIARDNWGVPHIWGKTDAHAIFGLMYAQCEDDFPRIEQNYLNALGRLAEAEGEKELFRDLRMRLFIDPDELREQYAAAAPWLRELMNAWADGINFYLSNHPEVTPRVLRRFEPWMALAFSEGSIGGDIERISVDGLAAFYGDDAKPLASAAVKSTSNHTVDHAGDQSIDPIIEPTGSNGIAIAPSRSATGNPLLLINPHTSFYFREEAHIVSHQGSDGAPPLEVYGAITWGQFFVYQGWNRHAAWMHTSSTVDNIDEYREAIVEQSGALFSRSGGELRPLVAKTIDLSYRVSPDPAAPLAKRRFTVYYSPHGPVVRSEGARAERRWIAVSLMHRPVLALEQSFLRTKARTYTEFREVMRRSANSSNNTVFAASDGTIAYFHANFVPRRDPSLDWTKPVDGSDPRADWRGLHTLEEMPNVKNPRVGWIQNTNDWPYSSAGPDSPRAADFAAYFDAVGETPRGVAATRVLSEAKVPFTLESLLAAAFDPRMPELEAQIPLLVAAWDGAPAADPLRVRTADAVALLRAWDYRWGADSQATTLAVLWAEALWEQAVVPAKASGITPYAWMRNVATPAQRLAALDAVMTKLTSDFGRWKVAWGFLNRFQRISPTIEPRFSDAEASTPVAFAPGRWGSLASFAVAPPKPGLKHRYGISGNSFVAVVELGRDRVRAQAVMAGGLAGDPRSKHFADQAPLYARGRLRPVYFEWSELVGHIERLYHPGE